MKFFKNRILPAFIAAVLAVFLVFSTPTPRNANAQASALIPIIQMTSSWIMDQVMSSVMDMAGGIGQTIMGTLMPFMEDQFSRFSREQRMSQIEQVKQEGELLQAELAMDHAARMEDQRYQIAKDRMVSDGECQEITGAILSQAGAPQAEITARELEEALRRDQDFVASPGGGSGGGGGVNAEGIVAASSALFEFRMLNTCSKQEHRGNLENICQNTDPEAVDKDLRTDWLALPKTFPKDEKHYVLQMLRYLVPPAGTAPVTDAIQDGDPEMEEYYLALKKAQAKRKAMVQYLTRQTAERMEPTTCPAVPGGDSDRISYVNAIDQKRNITPDPNRPCPSNAEFEHYRMLGLTNPQFNLECDGDAQTERCKQSISIKQTELMGKMNRLLAFKNLIDIGKYMENRAPQPQPVGN